MVPVRSLSEVQGLDAGQLNIAALNRACDAVGTDCVMVFTFETERPEATVHVRMFAPRMGVSEDPATGSANGARTPPRTHDTLATQTTAELETAKPRPSHKLACFTASLDSTPSTKEMQVSNLRRDQQAYQYREKTMLAMA